MTYPKDPHHPNPTVGRASGALERLKPKILASWEMSVRDQIRPANRQPTEELRDHVPTWIDELIRTLNPHRSGTSVDAEDPASRRIGLHRATMNGYTLPIVMKEYALLRRTILEALEEDGSLEKPERELINAAVDNALALAGDEFSGVQRRLIESALRDARRSNAQLERFAASAAHDLKTPLTTMTAYLDQIEQLVGERWAAPTHFVGKMRGQVTRLTTMIDRFLAYASLGTQTPEFTAVSLGEVVRLATENAQPFIEASHAVVTATPELPTVRGDLPLLTQLFQNLILNAVKFNASRPPRVWIRGRVNGPEWQIEVEDNGIGFAADEGESIFEAHRRLRPDEYPGSGLGLAIVKRIIDIHGGRIAVHSGIGRGTNFVMHLPVHRDQSE